MRVVLGKGDQAFDELGENQNHQTRDDQKQNDHRANQGERALERKATDAVEQSAFKQTENGIEQVGNDQSEHHRAHDHKHACKPSGDLGQACNCQQSQKSDCTNNRKLYDFFVYRCMFIHQGNILRGNI